MLAVGIPGGDHGARFVEHQLDDDRFGAGEGFGFSAAGGFTAAVHAALFGGLAGLAGVGPAAVEFGTAVALTVFRVNAAAATGHLAGGADQFAGTVDAALVEEAGAALPGVSAFAVPRGTAVNVVAQRVDAAVVAVDFIGRAVALAGSGRADEAIAAALSTVAGRIRTAEISVGLGVYAAAVTSDFIGRTLQFADAIDAGFVGAAGLTCIRPLTVTHSPAVREALAGIDTGAAAIDLWITAVKSAGAGDAALAVRADLAIVDFIARVGSPAKVRVVLGVDARVITGNLAGFALRLAASVDAFVRGGVAALACIAAFAIR